MSADVSLQIIKRTLAPISLRRGCHGNNLPRFQRDIAVLRFACNADLLKNTVVLADDIARDTDVVDVLFQKNTPILAWDCHNAQVQKFH